MLFAAAPASQNAYLLVSTPALEMILKWCLGAASVSLKKTKIRGEMCGYVCESKALLF